MRNNVSKRKTTHLEKEKKMLKLFSKDSELRTFSQDPGSRAGCPCRPSCKDIPDMHGGRKASRRFSCTRKQCRNVASTMYRTTGHLTPQVQPREDLTAGQQDSLGRTGVSPHKRNGKHHSDEDTCQNETPSLFGVIGN